MAPPSATAGLPPAIVVRGLFKSFGTLDVLKGVDLDVGAGENVVVLGRSGSGKSVLIKILVGLLPADAGEVSLLGQDVLGLKQKALDALRVRVGFSFQMSALYDSMDVGENLSFPLRMNTRGMSASEIEDRVIETLRAVGLEQKVRQMPSELSGGQRKRVGIARALILRPEVMLYDEPTAGLDPITSAEINDLIREVQETHHTSSIVITHDLTCAKTTADRVGILLEGQLSRVGPFDDLFATDDPRVRAFYDYNFTQAGHP